MSQFGTSPQREAVKALAKCGSKKAAARFLGISPCSLRDRLDNLEVRAARHGYILLEDDDEGVPPAGYQLGKRTVHRRITEGPDGRTSTCVDVWDRQHPQAAQLEAHAEAVLETLSIPRARKLKPPTVVDRQAWFQCLGDMHVGMLAWGEETGYDDYDIKLARERAMDCTHELLGGTTPCEVAYIADVGDYHHTDNKQGITQRGGNVLDTDTRYARMCQAAFDLACLIIDANLLRHGRVVWQYVPGNHNDLTSWWNSRLLDKHYANEPRVTVNVHSRSRVYWKYGVNIFGLTHGDKVKQSKLPTLMAQEHPDYIADAAGYQRRVYMTGHRHHQETVNLDGVIIETFETVAPPDSWHSEHGWVGAKRGMRGFIMPKAREGLIVRLESWL